MGWTGTGAGSAFRRAPAGPLVILLTLAGCGTNELASGWHDREVDDGGMITDWSGAVTTLEDGALSVGLLNDAERLYLFLYPENGPAGFALFARGFTLWFEGDEGLFGLRFPRDVPGDAGTPPGSPPDGDGAAPGAADGAGDPVDREAERERRRSAAGARLAEALREVEVLNADGEVVRRGAISELEGVELRVGQADTTPWVQVAVALAPAGEGAIAVGATPGERLVVGLVTPEIERPEGGGRGGRGRGGRPPGGGAPGGERPGRRGGRRGDRPEPHDPFKLSGRVVLATQPVDSSLF